MAYRRILQKMLAFGRRILRAKGHLLPGLRERLLSRVNQPVSSSIDTQGDANRTLFISQEQALHRFLDRGGTIRIGNAETNGQAPLVSLVVVLFNQAPLTYACLSRLAALQYFNLELLIVDNGSSDLTRELLDRVQGNVRILRPGVNLHFLRACNLAFKELSAESRYVGLVNNDALLTEQVIDEAIAVFKRWPETGIVGGQILHLDGQLQEAGNTLFQDGSCRGIGRRQSSWHPIVQTRRMVDYVSGCFLLIDTSLLREVGGFDERFSPAYYEETDLCVESWKRNRPVVYEPRCLLHHVEFASSAQGSLAAIKLMERNCELFLRKHQHWLSQQPRPQEFSDLQRIEHCLRSSAYRARILWIDDRLPDPAQGAGFGRLNMIIKELANLNIFVTLFATDFPRYGEFVDLSCHAESSDYELTWGTKTNFCSFLDNRQGFYTHIVASRRHNLSYLESWLNHRSAVSSSQPVLVGDIESIFSIRQHCFDILERRGTVANIADLQDVPEIDRELKQSQVFDRLMAVSEREQKMLHDSTGLPVALVGHAFPLLDPEDLPNYEETRGLLFMGAMNFPGLPNLDSLKWLAEAILPALRDLGQIPPEAAPLTVVGPFRDDLIQPLLERIASVWPLRHLGRLDDVGPELKRHRLFLAPTRFASGIPHKVQHAISRGVPVVTTELLAIQMGWNHGEGLLFSNDPVAFAARITELYTNQALWEQIQRSGLDTISHHCQPERLRQGLIDTFLCP